MEQMSTDQEETQEEGQEHKVTIGMLAFAFAVVFCFLGVLHVFAMP